jgi:EpsI family protein
MTWRCMVAAFLLAGGIFATHRIAPPNVPPAHRPLREFPAVIAARQSQDFPYEPDVVEAIGADDYINRVYLGDVPPVELYVGYYGDERSGDRIHSPRNCLPGSGWEPVRSAQLEIGSLEGRPAVVNEYVVEQGARRALVLYWYQTRHRVIASEYAAKYWLVVDGVRRRSTDGTMVRIWTTTADGDASAQTRAADFARQVFPNVAQLLTE